MIATIEGLSCAGKTELIGTLHNIYPESYAVVPEFVLDTTAGTDTTLCQVNDIAKTQMAKLRSVTAAHVLVDRGFPSTISYAHAAREENVPELQDWYDAKINEQAILLPELFIYLRISAKEAMRRAVEIGRSDERYAWYTAPERAYAKYEEYFASFPYSADVWVIDAEDVTTNGLVSVVHQKITGGGING